MNATCRASRESLIFSTISKIGSRILPGAHGGLVNAFGTREVSGVVNSIEDQP
jgi:hypothetical protein